jgi:hypothetical protein
MKKINVLFFCIAIFCSTNLITAQDTLKIMAFTQNDYDLLQEGDLFSEIDFYNTEGVTLYRQLNSNELTASNGILKIIDNIYYEYIELPRLNVGRFYATSGYSDLRICFDARHPENSLKFEMLESDGGETLFYLSTFIDGDHDAVNYAGNTYHILEGPGFTKDGTNFIYLAYDNIKEVNKETKKEVLESFGSRRKEK